VVVPYWKATVVAIPFGFMVAVNVALVPVRFDVVTAEITGAVTPDVEVVVGLVCSDEDVDSGLEALADVPVTLAVPMT
jgi:hypothetical protein